MKINYFTNKIWIGTFLVILGMFFSLYRTVDADSVSRSIGFQGQLFTGNTPVNDSVDATFTFYDSETDGVSQGSAILKTVSVSNGYFGTNFSESDISGIDFSQSLWIEVVINGDTLSPRSKVNSVPVSNNTLGILSYSSAPSVGPAGSLYYNSSSSEVYVSNGSSWNLTSTTSPSVWNDIIGGIGYYGNVLIGTATSSNNLSVYGSIGIGTTTPTGPLLIASSTGSRLFSVSNSGDVYFLNNLTFSGQILDSNGAQSIDGNLRRLKAANSSMSVDYGNRALSDGVIGTLLSWSNPTIVINPATYTDTGLIVKGKSSQTGNLQEWQNSSGNALTLITSSGNIGIGTTTPGSGLHIVKTTEQFRSGYDSSNYWNATTNATGSTVFDAVGSGAGFSFLDKVNIDTIVPRIGAGTANGILYLDSNKDLQSNGVFHYSPTTGTGQLYFGDAQANASYGDIYGYSVSNAFAPMVRLEKATYGSILSLAAYAQSPVIEATGGNTFVTYSQSDTGTSLSNAYNGGATLSMRNDNDNYATYGLKAVGSNQNSNPSSGRAYTYGLWGTAEGHTSGNGGASIYGQALSANIDGLRLDLASGQTAPVINIRNISGSSLFTTHVNDSTGKVIFDSIGSGSGFDFSDNLTINGTSTDGTYALKVISPQGANSSSRKGFYVDATAGAPNGSFYAFYADVQSHSGNYGLYIANGNSYINGTLDMNFNSIINAGNLKIQDDTSLTNGNLYLGDTTSGHSSGRGGDIVFAGDDRSQGGAFAVFAGIRGIKENSSYLDQKGALVFMTNPTSAVDGSQGDKTDLTEKARITSEGYFGIGTTTPSFPLDVYTTVDSDQSYGYLNPSGAVGTAGGISSYSIRARGRILAPEFNAVSDARLKDVQFFISDEMALDSISRLQPVSFTWKKDPNGQPVLGFLAQDVEVVIPNAVSKISTENFTDQRSLDYNQIVTMLVGAIKEIKSKIDTLTQKVVNISTWFDGDSLRLKGDICVDDVCVTKEQFKQMILNNGAGAHYSAPTNVYEQIPDNSTETEELSISEVSPENDVQSSETVEENVLPVIENENETIETPIIVDPTPISEPILETEQGSVEILDNQS